MTLLTITIPIYESTMLVERAIRDNSNIFSKYPIVIINKSGGEKFKEVQLGVKFIDQDSKWWDARKYALEFVQTKYVLCLDLDTVLPTQYIEQAIEILETKPDVACVALNYASPHNQPHLAFGTSIWRVGILKRLYYWKMIEERCVNDKCECIYMWDKVASIGMKVETLPMEAIHLKGLE